jgi:hypothetical protein
MVARFLRPLGLLTVLISLSSGLSACAELSVCQANPLLIGSVANKPFTAEVRIASWQLSNGNREEMDVARIVKVARDSSGRVMEFFRSVGRPTKPESREISLSICRPPSVIR